MVRLAAFEPLNALVQIERAFQAFYLGQNLIVAGRSDLFECGESALDAFKAGIHIPLDGVQMGMHGAQFRR